MMRGLIIGFIAFVGIFAGDPRDAAAATETVLHDFKGAPDGAFSTAELISAADGVLYGTTSHGGTGICPELPQSSDPTGCGTVFKLTPPAKGKTAWAETILYSFKGKTDGAGQSNALVAGANGVLYGTTENGGTGPCKETASSPAGCGTVFELKPPTAGKTAWTETVIYTFKGGADGATGSGSLLVGRDGILYGTTAVGGSTACPNSASFGAGCGTIFKLTPPAAGKTAWTETILYKFKGGKDGLLPTSGLIADASGVLYGTTHYGGANTCPDTKEPGCGTIFKLTPPAAGKTVWTETVLYNFKGGLADGDYPQAKPIADKSGALSSAGGTSGNQCIQPGTKISGCGTIVKLTPPAAGKTAWTETVLYNFAGGTKDGATPLSGVITNKSGNLYGTTFSGGLGLSTVYRLNLPAAGKKWTETILYSQQFATGFYPFAAPLLDSSGALYGTTVIGGTGCTECGTVYKISP
jgi:uncharacterized repeat protein (TIGR03803 family)